MLYLYALSHKQRGEFFWLKESDAYQNCPRGPNFMAGWDMIDRWMGVLTGQMHGKCMAILCLHLGILKERCGETCKDGKTTPTVLLQLDCEGFLKELLRSIFWRSYPSSPLNEGGCFKRWFEECFKAVPMLTFQRLDVAGLRIWGQRSNVWPPLLET